MECVIYLKLGHSENIFTEAGFKVASLVTGANQTPAHTINWVLGKLVNDIPDDVIKAEIMGMSVRELLSHEPTSAFWQRIIAALPDNMVSEFACGNTLIAVKS